MICTTRGAALVLALGLAMPASGADLLDDARQRLAQGDPRGAEIQLKNLLRGDPDHIDALLALTDVYLEQERPDLARASLQRARHLDAPGDRTAPRLARVYLQQGAYSLLLDEVHSHESYPAPVRAALVALRGQALLSLGREEAAAEAFDVALELDSTAVDAHLGAARLALERRELARVRLHLDAVFTADAANADGWLIEGELARLEQDPQRALEAFAQALERRPASTLARLGRAAVLLGQGDLSGADQALQPVLQRAPNHPLANYLRGELAWRDGRPEEAKGAAELALGRLPGHLPSHFMLGAILQGEGRAEEALPHLSIYVQAMPEHVPARALLAAAQLDAGQPSAALQTLAPALDAHPDDLQLLALAAGAHLRAGDAQRAAQLYARAAELDPDAAALRGRLAMSLLASGQGAAAGAQLQAAQALGLGAAQAATLSAQLALQREDFAAAVTAARELQRVSPDDPMGHNLEGVAHLGAGDLDAARRAFEAALERRADFTLAVMNLAALDLEAGDPQAAEARYRAVLETHAGYVPAAMGLARLARERGDLEAAAQWAEQARAADPEAREPRTWLFAYHLEAGRGEEALALARELAAAHPQWPQSYRLLGQAQQAVKLIKRALESYARLVELQPGVADNHYLHATAKAEYGDLDGARASLEQALSLEPGHLQAHVALGALEARAELPQAALEVAAEIQRRHPDRAAGFELEGDVRMTQRAHGGAAAAYAQGFAREPSAQLARKQFAAHRAAGDQDRAFAVLEEWLAAEPQDVAIRTLLAQAYQSAGDHARARGHYRAVLAQQPKRADVLNNLAWMSLEEDPDQARDWAERAYGLAPEDAAVVDTYGLVLLQQGQFSEAARVLQEALLRAPQSSDIRFHLAQALEKTGDWDSARRHVKQVLFTDPQFHDGRAAESLLQRLEEKAAGAGPSTNLTTH